jgi:hypothetical protein
VLGTPPAFNLSQDQTLQLITLSLKLSRSQTLIVHQCFWHEMNTGRLELESSIAPKAHRRESLHKLPVQIFKEYPVATKASGELPSIARFSNPSIAEKSRKARFRWRARSISVRSTLSTDCHIRSCFATQITRFSEALPIL